MRGLLQCFARTVETAEPGVIDVPPAMQAESDAVQAPAAGSWIENQREQELAELRTALSEHRRIIARLQSDLAQVSEADGAFALPCFYINWRDELAVVRADRDRVEQINDRQRARIRELELTVKAFGTLVQHAAGHDHGGELVVPWPPPRPVTAP